MLTIPYQSYSPEAVNKHMTEGEDVPGTVGIRRYSGVSPFELPEMIEVDIRPGNTLLFRFVYPNHEPAETEWRALTVGGDILGRLGTHTRKLIEIQVAEAGEKLSSGGLRLDPLSLAEWLEGLPAEAFNAAVRNFGVVSYILDSMPRDFRRRVLAELTSSSEDTAT